MSERLTPEGLCTACSATGYCAEHKPVKAHPPAVTYTPVSIEAQLTMAESVLEAIGDALHGNPVSDFMESFPLVRAVMDLKGSSLLTDEELEDAAGLVDAKAMHGQNAYWDGIATKLRGMKGQG